MTSMSFAARVSRRWVEIACAGFAALAVGSWLLTAAAHVGDSYGADRIAGVWLALARYAGEGTLYPPIFDGHSFGGTRYMPIPIALDGGLGAAIGDYLVAAKLIGYAMTGALLALVFAVLRYERCPAHVAAFLASLLLVTETGAQAATWIRNDTLPVVLQLAAVALIVRSTTRSSVMAAGGLSALALASKLSAVWAPVAVALWLLARVRHRLPLFLAAYVTSVAALLATFEVITGGRLSQNLQLGLSTARGFPGFDWELTRVRLIFGEGLGPLRVLVVLGVVLVVTAAWQRRLTLYDVSLLVSLPILAVVFADVGTWVNQLVDLQALSLVVVGAEWRALRPFLRGGILVVLLVASVASYAQHVSPVRSARTLVERNTSRVPAVARALDPRTRILSEDPYVPLALGQRPIVTDPYMLWNIAHRYPTARDNLVRRLDAREFDAIILLHRPEERSRSDFVRNWYDTVQFGSAIADAIQRNYHAARSVGGLWIYRPGSVAPATTSGVRPGVPMRRGSAACS